MYSAHRNSFLQTRSSGGKARAINRSVNLARRQPTIDGSDFEPELHRLTSEQPSIPLDNFDLTRRPLAFGRLAMPALREELRNRNPDIMLQVVSTIMDLAHNPEKGYEAIQLKIPDKLIDHLQHEEPAIRERTCMLLIVLANAVDGKLAIAKNPNLVAALSLLVDDVEAAVRIRAAKCLRVLTTFWPAADELIDFGFIPILLDCVCKDVEIIVSTHLETLNSLMYEDDGIEYALETDGFPTFISLLECHNYHLKVGGLKCLCKLLSLRGGKLLAIKNKILPELTDLLDDERPEVYEAATCALMFATIESSAVLQATTIKVLPERLMTICYDQNPIAKLYAMKTLLNICGHPEVRKYMKKNYLGQIEAIEVGDNEDLKKYKDLLLTCVNWRPRFM